MTCCGGKGLANGIAGNSSRRLERQAAIRVTPPQHVLLHGCLLVCLSIRGKVSRFGNVFCIVELLDSSPFVAPASQVLPDTKKYDLASVR
jgi:hypothetical protein